MTGTASLLAGVSLVINQMGYAYLKVAGKGEALDTARAALSVRFNRGPRKKAEESVQ